MRRLGSLLAAALAFAVLSAPAQADGAPVLSPLPSDPFAPSQDKYVNPIADPSWGPARTDMGVDWIPGPSWRWWRSATP